MIDNVSIELLAKALALVISIVTAYKKLFLEVFSHRRARLREEYKFVKEFLADIAMISKPHPYLIEKGFSAVSGKDNLTAAEILFFLTQSDPSLSLKRYSAARRRYVEYSENERRVRFQKDFVSAKKRGHTKIINAIGYFIFAIFSLIPLFFASNLFGKNWQAAAVFVVMSLAAFGPLAILCLVEVRRVVDGEKLVKGQGASNP